MSNEKQLSEKGGRLVVCDTMPREPHPQDADWCKNPRAAPSASLSPDEIGAQTELEAIHDVVTGARPPEDFEPASGTLGAVIRALAAGGAPSAQQPRAAPPISLEEQAQPDAQDLTEEEIDRLEWAVRHAVQPSVSELVPRLIANEKRRRGIK